MKGALYPIWENARVYVIGGGPSVKDLDPELLRDKKVIVANNAYQLFPWAAALYFMDEKWFYWHQVELKYFGGFKVTTTFKCLDTPGIVCLQHGERNGWDTRPEFLSRGGSSGDGAISVAVRLGGTEIVLAAGFDQRVVDGKHNYHDDHLRPVHDNIYPDQHLRWLNTRLPKLANLGIKIVNCTPDSALTSIPCDLLENWL